ncbi:TRAP transporter substrate-binding protein [Alkalihalobacterium chitinilyticum]|uniref:TRAP transporter substrate-binding protein DctP n=1 Tax=Alkalihalobacterium chitinilyticum TaxID=2980103 RepID=A0ABT5VGX4_9BACI|nr:TRAP transporter substrate-binding protein DctP [Alkalihalobacterium chitinilyticum]MDE5414525.1 TRAP transporter substrate-binding protein DctP [Alkalihalobacterium chitinilyticum]
MIKKTMLRAFLFVAFVLMITFITAACGGNNSTSAPLNENNEETKAEAETTTTNSDEIFTLKMNSMYPPSVYDWEPKYFLQEKFAEEVELRTDGRVKIEIFYSNQLAGQAESLDALSRGTIDMQNGVAAVWADRIPEGLFQGLPYWNLDEDTGNYLLHETELRDLYSEALEEYGVKLIGNWATSLSGYMSTEPMITAEDFRGKVVNSMSALTSEYFRTLGSGIATVPFVEQYEGLLRGTIDAIPFPFYSLDTYKLHEVVNYITVPPLYVAYGEITASLTVWNKLPEDLQNTILEVAREMEELATEGSKRLTDFAFEVAEENGVELVKMSKEDYEEVKQVAIDTAWQSYAAINERTQRMVEILIEENEEFMQSEQGEAFIKEFLQD